MTAIQINNKDLYKTYKFIRYRKIPTDYKLKLLNFIRIKFAKHIINIIIKYRKISKIYHTIKFFTPFNI